MVSVAIVVAAWALLHSGLARVQADCPNEWTRFRYSCYVVIDDKETWYEAEEMCKVFGGGLVQIDGSAENDFVKRFARGKHFGNVWTGGNALANNRKWAWLKGVDPFTFTDWATGEPVGSIGSRCLQLWSTHDFKWDDANCHTQLAYMCESPYVSPFVI